MSEVIKTGKVRFCWISVFQKKQYADQEPRYEVTILIPKTDKKTIRTIENEIQRVYEENKALFKGKSLESLKTPLHDGSEKSAYEGYEGCHYMNLTTKRRPRVLKIENGRFEDIEDEDEFYSGCYGKATITFFAYSKQGLGIGVRLCNLIKLEEGEPLSGGANAEADFAEELGARKRPARKYEDDDEGEDDDEEGFSDKSKGKPQKRKGKSSNIRW